MNAKPNKKKTHYYANGSVLSEEWLDADGRLHREDGPAWIKYHADGSVLSEEWFVDDKLHREDGPAMIWYHADGSVMYKAWHVNDMLLSKEQHIAWHRNQVIDTVLNQDS